MPSPGDDAKARRAERLRKALAIAFDGKLYEEKAEARKEEPASAAAAPSWLSWLCPCCPRRAARAHAA